MKKRRLLIDILLIIILTLSLFVPTSISRAQTGQEWSVPINLSLSDAASKPLIVVDFQGTIHVIWVDIIDGYKYTQSADGGITWTTPINVKFPFDPKGLSPVLIPDEVGAINIFWITDSNLFYARSSSSDFATPQNWKSSTRVARDILSFDVSLDSRGAFHVAYIRKISTDVTPSGVYYRQSSINGGYWLDPVLLYTSDYFRASSENDSYVRISTANYQDNEQVYVTWDNRALKRVFMSVSLDTGATWEETQQIKGPEDTGGIGLPFNLTVASAGNHVLLLWQVGEPGASACTIYSQWSVDSGKNWTDTVAPLGGRSECPTGIKIIDQSDGYISVLMVGTINPILIAWDGAQWSNTQSQILLPPISNPLTLDTILLGCRFDFFYRQYLYVTGCDQGTGGDIWFLSRSLGPVESWFSPLTYWGDVNTLPIKTDDLVQISNFISTPDTEGNIHALWSQSVVGQGDQSETTIEYSRWDGSRWSTPESVISNMDGLPVRLFSTVDPLKRLLLTWIDGYNGDLVFSWANADRAYLVSEWGGLTGLPAPSRLIDEADIVVDGNGRIVVAYTVPLNEERGLYVTQSNDSGKSWTTPVRVFDAISEGWEDVTKPRMSLGADGVLHIVFVRKTLRVGQSVGLYYTRSEDGGTTWSNAQILSDREVHWVDITSYDKVVHVVWQEYDGLAFANISQFSQDNGLTWSKQNNVAGVNANETQVSLASDQSGRLHFFQIANRDKFDTPSQKDIVLQDWKWDGTRWVIELEKDLVIRGEDIRYSLSTNITSTGFLNAFIPVVFTDSTKKTKSEILTLTRYLEDVEKSSPLQIPIIPASIKQSDGNDVPILEPTPTPDLSILYDDNVSTSPLQKNAVGLVLVGLGTVATLVLLFWRRKPADIDS